MEQQKALIIIISAALFIAAVLGVGLALFYPDAGGEARAAAREFEPIEYARSPEESEPERAAEAEEESVIVYGEDEETPDPEAEETQEERVIVLTEEGDEAVDTEEPEGQLQEGPSDESGLTSRRARQSPTVEPEPPSKQEKPEASPSRVVSANRSATSYQSAPEPEPQRIRVTEHWIQLISSPNRERVDLVRGQLREEYSLGARVTTREVDGATYYRLRVGPYDDRPEAEKFLDWIQEIEGFSEAYISEEYRLRTVR